MLEGILVISKEPITTVNEAGRVLAFTFFFMALICFCILIWTDYSIFAALTLTFLMLGLLYKQEFLLRLPQKLEDININV